MSTPGLPRWLCGKNLAANEGEKGLGRSPEGGFVNLLQYSCLGNHRYRGGLVGYRPWHHKELDTVE